MLAGTLALALLSLCCAAVADTKPLQLTTRSDGSVQGVGGRYALVVGINDYSQAGLGALQFCETDAAAVRDRLVSAGGFPAANVTLLQGSQASLENILHYLDNLRQASIFPQADTFVLYFSGHGGQIEAPGSGPNSTEVRDQYLIPANGSSDAVLAQRLNIPLGDVLRALDASVFKRKVLFIDACRVVLKTDGSKAGQPFAAFDLGPYAAATGVKGMAGALPGHFSWEDAALGDPALGYGHGVFTYYLLHGLDGAAADANHVVTFNGLDEYIATAMAEYSRAHPERAQSPQPFGEGNGGIALALVTGHGNVAPAGGTGPGAASPLPPVAPPAKPAAPEPPLGDANSALLERLGLSAAQDPEVVVLAAQLIDFGYITDKAANLPLNTWQTAEQLLSTKLLRAPSPLAYCLAGMVQQSLYYADARDNQQQHYDAAVRLGKQATQLAPDWPFGHFQLAAAYQIEGYFDESIAQLHTTIGLAPNWALPHDYLGMLYSWFMERDAEAEGEFSAALAIDPSDKFAQDNLKTVRERLKK